MFKAQTFVGVLDVYRAGGIGDVSPSRQPHHNAPVNTHGIALHLLAYKTDPLPPYPTPSAGGTSRNFSPLFYPQGVFMFGLLKSVTDLAVDVVKVAAAPVEVVVDLAGAVVKPVAEAAEEVVKEVKSLKD